MQLPVNGDADDIGPFLIQQIPEPNISISCTNEVILGMYVCVVYDIGQNQWYFIPVSWRYSLSYWTISNTGAVFDSVYAK